MKKKIKSKYNIYKKKLHFPSLHKTLFQIINSLNKINEIDIKTLIEHEKEFFDFLKIRQASPKAHKSSFVSYHNSYSNCLPIAYQLLKKVTS